MNLRDGVLGNASILFLGFFLLIGTDVQAQENDYEDFRDRFKSEYFSIGMLLQTFGDYRYRRLAGTGSNGYSVGNARVQFFGEIDQSFGYQLQANFIKNPAVLDANMYYQLTTPVTLKAGLFKSPFSGEFLRSASALDFVNRSTVVNQLAPNRQIGIQMGGDLAEGKLSYKAGIFNGNGFDINRNSDGNFLYTGRFETDFTIDDEVENRVVFGINASYEQKDQVARSGNLRSTFDGEQILLGTDLRVVHNKMLLSGEFIYSSLESDFGMTSYPFGYQITAGYFIFPKVQLLGRWDYFENDNISRVAASEKVIAGLNYPSTSFSKIQLNYILPTDQEVEFSQILLNLQISL